MDTHTQLTSITNRLMILSNVQCFTADQAWPCMTFWLVDLAYFSVCLFVFGLFFFNLILSAQICLSIL